MLHGILVTFDANLGANSEESMQKYALASLAEVMNFMGPNYMTQYKYKILATLRTALTFTRPGFRNLACNAWSAFIRKYVKFKYFWQQIQSVKQKCNI